MRGNMRRARVERCVRWQRDEDPPPFASAGCGPLSPAAGALVSYAVFSSKECGRARLRFFFLALPVSVCAVCALRANGVQMTASVKAGFSFCLFLRDDYGFAMFVFLFLALGNLCFLC